MMVAVTVQQSRMPVWRSAGFGSTPMLDPTVPSGEPRAP
jgi:hypothetical protein